MRTTIITALALIATGLAACGDARNIAPGDGAAEDVTDLDDAAVMDDVTSPDEVAVGEDVPATDVASLPDVVRVDAPVVDRPQGVDVAPPRDVAPDVVIPPGPTCATSPTGRTAVSAPTMVRGLQASGDEGWLGSVAVADLDRDGQNEVIAARGAQVVVWRATGEMRWAHAVSGSNRVWAAPLVGDFTGDANLEVVAAAGDRVTMFTATGSTVTRFPVTWREELRSLAGGDLDADGRPEVVTASTVPLSSGGFRDLVMAWHGDGTVMRGYPPNTSRTSGCDGACDVTGGFDQNLAIGLLDDDAQGDIIAPHDNAYMSWHHGSGEAFRVASIFDGVTRSPGVRFLHDYAEAQQGYSEREATSEQAHFTNSPPTIADLDGDGAREIVVLASVQNASQTDRRRGVALWVVRPDGTRPAAWTAPFQARTYLAGLTDLGGNVVAATNQVTVADIDNRSTGPEMIFAGFDGRIHCVGADRAERWSYAYTTAATVLTGGVAVADLSGDGRPEVVFATYSTASGRGALVVLNSDGAMQHQVALPGRGAMAVPTLADVDRNGTLEVLVSLKDAAMGNEVLVYTVANSTTGCLLWPTGRANNLRNGVPTR